MKKLSILTLIITVLITFTGCAYTGTKKPKATTELNLALREGTYAEVVKAGVSAFEKEYGISCNVYEYSESDLHDIVMGKQKSEPMDLYMVDGSWIAECVAKERLLCLDDYDVSLDSDIIPATTTISYMDNHFYVAPYYGNVTVLLYNVDGLMACGYDANQLTSMERIHDACIKANSEGKLGFLYRGDTNSNIVVDFLPVLLSYGGWVVDEEEHPIVNSGEFLEAFSFYMDLIETGQPMVKEDMIAAVTEGKALMGIGWPGWYSPTELSPVKYCALQGRIREDTTTYNAGVYGIWTLGVSAETQQDKMSVELLKYLMDKEVQKESIVYGGVPCRYSCLDDAEVLKNHPEFEAVCDALERGKYRPIMAEWNEFCEILGQEMNQAILGEKEPKEALESAQKQLETLLED